MTANHSTNSNDLGHFGIHQIPKMVRDSFEHFFDAMGLFGRREEALALIQAYERVSSRERKPDSSLECVLISGHSGTGKTALAHSLLPRVKQDNGFCLSGKFELTKLQDPFAVFVAAFTHFIDSLVVHSSNAHGQLDCIRKTVQEAVGGEGKYLTNVIPSLEVLTGPQEKVADIKGTDATQLFRSVFCKLCQALSKVAPVVLFLDDLQWSDTSSLELLQALLKSQRNLSESSGILVVLAYRDEEIYNATQTSSTSKGMRLPFLSYLHQFRQLLLTTAVTKIQLESLNESSFNELVAGFLDMPETSTVDLAQAIFTKCSGNPYFALQILKLLITQGHLYQGKIDKEQHWQWNTTDIIVACGSTETVDELVCKKLAALPTLSQKVFQVAACMGDEIDEAAISTVMGMEIPEFEIHIQAGQGEELVEYQRYLGRFRFSHDRIRQVVLSTIDDKEAMMHHVGYTLWTKASVMFLAQKVFLVASLLNYGTTLMLHQDERYRAATFNLEAGIKAAALSSFPDSSRYLTAGIEYLKGGDYWKEQYQLTLNLFSTAADTEVCNQNFERVILLADEVLSHARTIQDKLRVHAAKISSLGQRGMLQETIEYGVQVLHELGEPLPQDATIMSIVFEVMKTKFALRGLSDEKLRLLPPMSDPTKLAAVHFMSLLVPYAFQSASNYYPLLGTRIARLCLKHGYHKACSLGFITFGWLLCGMGNMKEGHRLASVALSMIDKARAKEMLPRVHAVFYGCINHWRNPLRSNLERLENVRIVGMEVGDIEYAMLALSFKCTTSLSCGVPLPEVEAMMADACQKMALYKQETNLQTLKMSLQCIHNLTGRAPDRKVLQGEVLEVFDTSKSSRMNLVCYYYMSAILAFCFGDFTRALQISKQRQTSSFKPVALYMYGVMRQLDAVIAIANARLDPTCRKYAIKVGRKVFNELKGWAVENHRNYYFRQKIVEAEYKSLQHHRSVDAQIHACYKEAIVEAYREGFLGDAANFSELLGNYVRRQGDCNLARTYWKDALSLHRQWGATERAAYLLECHPELKVASS